MYHVYQWNSKKKCQNKIRPLPYIYIWTKSKLQGTWESYNLQRIIMWQNQAEMTRNP